MNQLTLPNGMTLLAEEMPHVRSAAMSFWIPAGSVYDPENYLGTSTVLVEMMSRGAGSRDSRELSDAFDRLGIDHSESNGTFNTTFGGALLSRDLAKGLEIFADILQRPHLPEEELEAVQNLVIQDIQSLEDDPQHKAMVELSSRYYPAPINRYKHGTEEGVSAITVEHLRAHHQKMIHPGGAILAIAGNFQWESLKDQVEKLFGDWKAQPETSYTVAESKPLSVHLSKDLEQTQIAIAFPSVPVYHPDFYQARGAVGIWSLDMSSRLFTNIREKHGLCYSVWAAYEALKDRGTIIGYAGAKPEKAQETLDRTLHEFRILKDGIEQDEVDRVKIGLKSSLIMRQESTAARASAMASDWYYYKRVRSLSEIQAKIDALTPESILDYARRFPAESFTIVTLGPEPLKI